MKFSVCLDSLYFDLKYFGASPENVLEGMNLAKGAGFHAVEFFGPRKDIPSIVKAKNDLRLEIGAIATTLDSWTWPCVPGTPAPFVTLCDPSLRDSYLENLRQRIAEAKQLDCKFIITHAGDVIKGASREHQRGSLVAGLKEAAKLVEAAEVTLVVEPINAIDHPGDFLTSSNEAFAILDEVGSPNVKLLYDIYHQQVMEGNLIDTITKNIKQIGYLHAASNPGRTDIRYGEINYREVLKAVAETGYDGYCGLEYTLKTDFATTLKESVDFMTQSLQSARALKAGAPLSRM